MRDQEKNVQLAKLCQIAFSRSRTPSNLLNCKLQVYNRYFSQITTIRSLATYCEEGDARLVLSIESVPVTLPYHVHEASFAEIAKHERECGLELSSVRNTSLHPYMIDVLEFVLSKSFWQAGAVIYPPSDLLHVYSLIAAKELKKIGIEIPTAEFLPKDKGRLPSMNLKFMVQVQLIA